MTTTPSNLLIWEAFMFPIQPAGPLPAKTMVKELVLKAGNEATLRIEIENILGAHDISLRRWPADLETAHPLFKRNSRNRVFLSTVHLLSLSRGLLSLGFIYNRV